MNNVKPLVCAVLAVANIPALAQQMPPPPTPSDPPVLNNLQLDSGERQFWENESRLVRQLRLMKLQAEIAEAQRDIEGQGVRQAGHLDAVNHPPMAPPLIRPGSTMGDAMLDVTPPPPPPPRPRRNTGALDVVSIWGLDGDHTADVVSNGMRIAVREGDPLPQGWKVEAIRRTGIVITRGKEQKTLVVAEAIGD